MGIRIFGLHPPPYPLANFGFDDLRSMCLGLFLGEKKAKSLILLGFFHFSFVFLRYDLIVLAEQAGFEPAVGLTPRTLSRRVT